MSGDYDIHLNEQVIGKAVMEKEGLYVRYICTCKLPENEIFRIIAQTAEGTVNLGICAPKGEHWETRGRIPLKQLRGNCLKITAKSCLSDNEQFVPISSGDKFAFLGEVKRLQFVIRDGQPGVLIK